LSETNKNSVGGTERSWSLLFWGPLVAAALLLLCGCAAQSFQPSGQEPQAGREGQASEQTSEQASEQTAEQTSEQTAKPAGDRGEAPQRDAALGHPGLGDADAPVVMVEYGDFQ
jgi:protein-disulfide isomerase